MGVLVRASIAYQIRTLRMVRGWTQEELASRAKLSTPTISRLEDASGESPQISTLTAVANAFDVALFIRFESWEAFVRHMAGLIPPAAFDADKLADEAEDDTKP